MTFWEHLEELRGVLIKSVCAWLLASIAAFALKDPLFTFLFDSVQDILSLIWM